MVAVVTAGVLDDLMPQGPPLEPGLARNLIGQLVVRDALAADHRIEKPLLHQRIRMFRQCG